MNARRLVWLAALLAVVIVASGVFFWRFVATHRPPPPQDPTTGYVAPGTERLLAGLVFRDCGLAPSPDGRFLVVAVRRRDTNGDGRITVRDAKTLLLIDRAGETTVLCEDRLVWQDKPVRWSPDGKLLAVAVPGVSPHWTYYDPTDVIVYDPEARQEIARYSRGINPLWLADGRLAFQRENSIFIVDSGAESELPIPPAMANRNLLRSFIEDPWRRRIIAAYSGLADVRLRSEKILAEGKPGPLYSWSETAKGWAAQVLPYDGYAPHPAADGLYYFTRRGDVSGNGTYELAQDGVDLRRDDTLVATDVAFNSFFDYPGLRAVLLRREGRFDLAEIDDSGTVARILVKGLLRHGATWVAHGHGRTVISAVVEEKERGPALYEMREGRLVKLASGPVTQPFLASRGVYCLRAAGEKAGELLFIPFDE